MRALLGLSAAILLSVGAWRIGDHMSSDAIGMAIGIVLGMVAGIPATMMILVAQRDWFDRSPPQRPEPRRQQSPQPPVFIVATQGMLPNAQARHQRDQELLAQRSRQLTG